jgi:hypothetical protein
VYSLDRRTGAATLLSATARLVVPSGNVFGLTEWGQSLVLASDTGSILNIQKFSWDGFAPTPWTPPGHWTALAIYFDSVNQWRFVLDSATDTLYRVVLSPTGFPPDSVEPVGPLGVDASDFAGMDGDFHDGVLYAALTVGGVPGLYTLDKSTGHATLIGDIGAASIMSLSLDFQAAPILTQLTMPQLPGSGYQFPESNVTVDFSVRRTGDDTVPADYVWETVPYPAGSNQATAGQDYVAQSQPLHFDAGEVEKHVSVQLLDDAERETQQSFYVRFRDTSPSGTLAQRFIDILDDDNKPPVLTVTSPAPLITTSSATIDITGTFTDEDPGTTVKYFLSSLYFPDGTTMANPWTFANVPLLPGGNTIFVTATDMYGALSYKSFYIVRTDVADQTFVFAEGSTGTFFHTDLLFANPNFAEIPVTVDFMREDGVVVPYALTLPPARRVTLDVGSIPGLEATAVAASVHTNNFPIVVERTMTWDKDGYGASTEKGASALSTTWLFAEGSQGFFKTFLLL